MFKKFSRWFSCRIIGAHEWTCHVEEGIRMTKEQVAAGEKGYWEYARMYCKHCGKMSKLNKV